MKINELRKLLKDKRVIEEIHKHLWIESQKAGHSIGIERATDEWLRLYANKWMKYHVFKEYKKEKWKLGVTKTEVAVLNTKKYDRS